MNHCNLENAGIYRATLEAMMFGTVTQETEGKGFNDSVLEKKTKNVNDLVKQFEKNMKLDETTVEIEENKQSRGSEEAAARCEAKPRSRIPSMEEFVNGILRTSSPLPPVKDDTPVVMIEQFEALVETPILAYRPAKLKVSTPDSAYNSPRSSESYGSPAASTRSSTSPQPQDSAPQDQEPKLDVFLKLARAQLHKTIKQYSTWNPETIQIIAESAATRRSEALQKIPKPCHITETMLQIYESCTSGQTNNEMDTVIVSISHLLEKNIDLPQISVLEEYLVMKFNKKAMQ